MKNAKEMKQKALQNCSIVKYIEETVAPAIEKAAAEGKTNIEIYEIIDEENEDRDIMLVHSKKGYWFREFSEDLPKLWIKDYKKTWWLKEDLSE